MKTHCSSKFIVVQNEAYLTITEGNEKCFSFHTVIIINVIIIYNLWLLDGKLQQIYNNVSNIYTKGYGALTFLNYCTLFLN